MRTTKFECDNCGKDISSTGNLGVKRTRLVLDNEHVSFPAAQLGRAGPVTRFPFNGPCHFCDMACLQLWVNNYRSKNQANE